MRDSEFHADIVQRTAAQWTVTDPYLPKNDLGIESDTGRMKVGVGLKWSATPYVYDTIQVRRATTAEWAAENPVLSLAEPGYDTQLKRLKIGDGTNTWSALNFIDVGPPQIVSGGLIANLTSGQQAAISTGTVVTDTNGVRWVYSGSGSKASEGSYVQLADISPHISTVVGGISRALALALS